MLPLRIMEEIQRLAKESPRREICGIVSKDLRIFPIRNISPSPDSFLMNRKDHAEAMNAMTAADDGIKVNYHSHPFSSSASEKDLQFFRRSGVDMLIVTPTEWSYYVHDANKNLRTTCF